MLGLVCFSNWRQPVQVTRFQEVLGGLSDNWWINNILFSSFNDTVSICDVILSHRSPGRFVLNSNDPKKDALAKLKDVKPPTPVKVGQNCLHCLSSAGLACASSLSLSPCSCRKSSYLLLLLHRLWNPQTLLPPVVPVSFPVTCRRNRATCLTCSAERTFSPLSPLSLLSPFHHLLQNPPLPLRCMKHLSFRIYLTHHPLLPPHSVGVAYSFQTSYIWITHFIKTSIHSPSPSHVD